MLIIYREGSPSRERAVRITHNKHTWWVNPEGQIHHLTGVPLIRDHCILSFAAGLLAAGHEVFMVNRFLGRRETYGYFRPNSSPVVPVFYFVGLAWGRGEWDRLKGSLMMYVRPERRLEVLEHTARYYFDHPYGSTLDLQLP